MTEIFEKIKNIKIPKEFIPNDIYMQYLDICTKNTNSVKRIRISTEKKINKCMLYI